MSGIEDMQDEPEIETQEQTHAPPKEVIETQEASESDDEPRYDRRKRARLMESDSEEEIASGRFVILYNDFVVAGVTANEIVFFFFLLRCIAWCAAAGEHKAHVTR
jgi:hypothetical protein